MQALLFQRIPSGNDSASENLTTYVHKNFDEQLYMKKIFAMQIAEDNSF